MFSGIKFYMNQAMNDGYRDIDRDGYRGVCIYREIER